MRHRCTRDPKKELHCYNPTAHTPYNIGTWKGQMPNFTLGTWGELQTSDEITKTFRMQPSDEKI